MLIEFVQNFFPALALLSVITFAIGLILSVAGHFDRRSTGRAKTSVKTPRDGVQAVLGVEERGLPVEPL